MLDIDNRIASHRVKIIRFTCQVHCFGTMPIPGSFIFSTVRSGMKAVPRCSSESKVRFAIHKGTVPVERWLHLFVN
jgi:hypothetical protein